MYTLTPKRVANGCTALQSCQLQSVPLSVDDAPPGVGGGQGKMSNAITGGWLSSKVQINYDFLMLSDLPALVRMVFGMFVTILATKKQHLF